ncbi:MAG TPA: SRPBCC domain-containing protein [Capsulimonadaceae bacterium]
MKTCYYDMELSREYHCAPAAVFRAWGDVEAKRKWFVGPDKWVETGRSVDLREGGVETMTGNFDGRMTTEYTGHFYDVQENKRIGYSFEVRLGGEIYSISTVVVEFTETAVGTRMTYHEQLAVFSGQTVEESRANRIIGTQAHFDRLEGYLG